MARATNSPLNSRMLLAKERESRATQMRIEGHSVEVIAAELEMSEDGARDAITRTLERYRRHTRDNVQELLVLELDRCDQMMVSIFPFATGVMSKASMAQKTAVKLCLDIMKRRDKLAGLEHTIELHAHMSVTPEELEKLREKRWGRIEKHVANLLGTSRDGIVIEGEFTDADAQAVGAECSG